MWTQRDQVQAYQFLRRRLVSALVSGDANHPVSPSRRLILGSILGLAGALLVTAGFGIYGLVRPGASSDWRKTGQVVVASDTGASYVFASDGRLHPMTNYASARLLAGGDGTATASVSAKSLSAAPRGTELGIPGAPEALPAKASLLSGPWTVCAQRPPGGPADATSVTTALLGARPAGRALADTDALVVRDPRGQRYLLAQGRRFRMAAWAATAIGVEAVTPVRVPWSFLDAVPLGPDLAALPLSHIGSPGPRLGGRDTAVGQVLRTAAVGTRGFRYYVVDGADGVRPVTEFAATLLLNSAADKQAYPGGVPRPVDVAAADVAEAVHGAGDDPAYPERVPRALSGADDLAVCATGATGAPTALMLATSAVPPGAKPMPVSGGDDRTADAVYVPPGRGSLVRAGTVYLVTDQGRRFPVADAAALKALGYGSVRPQPVPATTLALLPTGPTLSTSAAAEVA
ncbi:MAG TPA: type VII secretion protein EccB [Actinocatenispora sp.]